MSIMEDLELLDLPDTLPEGEDFNLDHILQEFGFGDGMPYADDGEDDAPKAEPVSAPRDATKTSKKNRRKCPPKPERTAPVAADPAPESEELAEESIPVFEPAQEEQDHHNDFVFDVAEDEEDIKVYTPHSQAAEPTVVEEPEAATELPALDGETQWEEAQPEDTLLFDMTDWTADTEPVVPDAPAQTVSAQNAPGFFARVAAGMSGLFGRKRTPAPAPTLPADYDPEAEDADSILSYMALFTEDLPDNGEPSDYGDDLSEVPAEESLGEPIEVPVAEDEPDESAAVAEEAEADDATDALTDRVAALIGAETEIPADATVLFDALDLSADDQPEAPVPVMDTAPRKAPGFFARVTGTVMGLFGRKSAPAPVYPLSEEETDDDLSNLSDLFPDLLSGEDGMDLESLIEEIRAEEAAELEAELAARQAAERLAQEEAQKAAELEAQRLAQEEADEEARLAAEAARIQQEQEQQAEEALLSMSAEELDAWANTPAEAAEEADVTFTLELPKTESDPMADPEAMELPNEGDAVPAPDMELDAERSDDLNQLLDAPEIEPDAEAQTAEDAARKQKADDDLHYKPEETPAQTIASHMGKRFGAVFTKFTESGNDPGDREEDLGPEIPPSKAYRHYSKYVNGYRFRLRIATILSVILGWISLGLPVFGSLKNPAVASAMCLMLLLSVMLAGADILAIGVRNLLRRRPSLHSFVSLSCLVSVLDAVIIIVYKGKAGYLPFCGVSAVSMCFAIYGSLLYCRGQRFNFKTLDKASQPMTISVDYGIVDEETTTVYRAPGYPENYIHLSEEEDLGETVFGVMAPFMMPAIPVLALIAALISRSLGDYFHILAAMFAASASFAALVAFPLPYFLVQRDLYHTKAAVAGWSGAKEIGRVSSMIVSDRDLFPDETVSIESVRIVDKVPPQLTLSYICSIVQASGSCLVPAFEQLAENNDCDLYPVEDFQCHEAGGLSGNIGPDSVLVASYSYMKLQGFRLPAKKKDSENALFLAVNGHVIAYIIIEYKALRSVRDGLVSALRGTAEMIFAARDFNVTPLLISKKFKSATETLRFPSYKQRFEITAHADSETATCAAVVYRKSFYSYAVVVEKARNLFRSVTLAVTMSAVSSVMGVILMFVMAVTGAGAAVTVGRLLVFMLLWLVTTLALAVSITK